MMSTGVCRWLFLLISLATWTTIASSKEMRVVCYYTNWSVYRPGAAKFNPQNINPYLCTHLIYAFGGFTKENTLKPFDKYQDIEKGGYAKFTGLKTYNKNLKTMLAIGGWNEGSTRFSPMVANAERRKELVKNAIKFLRQNHFDGLDLDWEYPSFRDGGKPRDRDNYAQLVQELREEFDRESQKTGRPRLLLTMAVPAGIEYVNKGYDVPKLMKYLDWMNILSYDYHSAFEPAVNHHAPLYSLEEDNEYNYDAELNIDYTIKHYLKLGAESHKLVLGIPTYGRSYTLYNPDAHEIGSPADGPGDMGEATRENGYLAYYEICDYVKNQGWEVEQPNPTAMGPYAFKDNQWVGYDDDAIVRKKSEYVAENGLGGIMFWAIDNDDFRGNCHGKPYPLIEAAKEALLNAYGLTDDNLISPPAKIKSRTRTRTKAVEKIKTDHEEHTKIEKISNSVGSRRRTRPKLKAKEQDRDVISTRLKHQRKDVKTTTESPTTHSSLKIVTPSYTTPAPPSTPDSDGAFKCEDEGFFPHPKDCKKYFWCLSGAGDSGIVSHQFTCPAGLYFNKAADSCDYAQNVLCNKKIQKATTTTPASISATTTTTTTASTLFSTSRAPPKISAATSRTTYKFTTTTEAYDDDYEYEDDEEEDERGGKTEEDPQVIKELIELIKKAGGLEELEKQLSNTKTDVTNPSSDTTTPSAISKSLYERVLNKAVKSSLNLKKNPLTSLRNSRGPQNNGISQKDESSALSSNKSDGKLQYTSISRTRSSTEKSIEEVNDDEEVKEDNSKTRRTFSKNFQPEYVTIRRPRVSTTTEAIEQSDSSLNRNKILGETSDEEYDDDDVDDDVDEEGEEGEEEPKRKQHTPQYTNIRRQRPSTTEETATSNYTVIRRGSTSTTEPTPENDEEEVSSKYKTIRRGSTPSSTTTTERDTTSSRYQLRRGTTVSTTPSATSDGATSRFKNFRRGSSPKPTTNVNINSSSNDDDSATTPLDEENDVTPRSTTIGRGSTDSPVISTSLYPILHRSSTNASTLIDTNTVGRTHAPLATSSETSPSTEEKFTTLANIVDDEATPQLSSTIRNEVPNTDVKENFDSTESPTETSSSSLPISETETSQKNYPHLLAPKPFSVFPRPTVKPITEATIQNSKVSQSNFKFRLKPKDTSIVEVSSTSETPVSKSTHRFRGRGGSKFNLNIQPTKHEEENGAEDLSSKPKLRKRLSTTERYTEENRTYRPSEIADLSSLTAVDFAKIKELNVGGGTHRRRIRPTTSSSTSTSTESAFEEDTDVSLKTSSRTLPLARKLIGSSSFGSSKRVIPAKIDQINSSSEISTIKKVRGFGSRSTRQPVTTETTTPSIVSENQSSHTVQITPRSRRIVRRFRTTTSKSLFDKEAIDENQGFRRHSFVTKGENLTENAENSTIPATHVQDNKPISLQKLLKKQPTRLPLVLQKNDVEEEDDDSAEDTSTEEGENIKLSESNIRENSDVNNYKIGDKPNRRVFKLVRSKAEILHGKSDLQNKHLESEKKKISEDDSENVTENVTSSHTISEIGVTEKTINETTTESIEITTIENKTTETSTKPNVRTRKRIIRKHKPTTTVPIDKSSTSEPSNGRQRKIIRKIRPSFGIKKNFDSDGENQTKNDTTSNDNNQTDGELTAKHLFRPSITRPRSKFIKPVLEKEATVEAIAEVKVPARIALRKLPTRNSASQKLDSRHVTDTYDSNNSTKYVFRPRVSEYRNKYINQENKSDTEDNHRRVAFKSLTRTTTVKNDLLTENTTDINSSSTQSVSNIENITESTTKYEISISTTEEVQDVSAETTNFVDITTIKSIENSTEDLLSTTVEGDSTTATDAVTESSSSTEFKGLSLNTTEETVTELESETNTIVGKIETASPTTDNTINKDKNDSEETFEEPEDRKRNYVSVFRSSKTSNSFKDFDSESELETPKFEDLFEDKDTSKDVYDGFKIDTYKGVGGYRYDDDEDEYHKFADDSLIGDTSTEFQSKFFFLPNDDGEDNDDTDDDEDEYNIRKEKTDATESSSIRNHFYHPNRPSFARPKITFSTTEKQTPPKPKYKTFSRSSTKSLRKETIQIHSFNDTDSDGAPEKRVNTVLFTNHYKYKTSTSSPELINSVKLNESYSSSGEDIHSEATTLRVVDTKENTVTTESNEIKSVSGATSSNLVEIVLNEDTTVNKQATVATTNIDVDITTQLNKDDLKNNIDVTTTRNEISASEPETSTVTDSTFLQTETLDLGSTEIFTENYVETESTEDSGSTAEVSLTTVSDLRTPEINIINAQNLTTVSPETTTAYRRRSTLKPLNSRPKFTPVRRKVTTHSATEQSEDGLKKNKFNRSRFQKPTTETPDISDSPSTYDKVERTSTPSTISKFLHKYTRKPISTENKSPVESIENNDEDVLQEPANHESEFIEKINNVFGSTTAVPIKEYVVSQNNTEISKAKDNKQDDNEQNKGNEEHGADEHRITSEVDVQVTDGNVNNKPSTFLKNPINSHNSKLRHIPKSRVSNIPTGKIKSNSSLGRSTTPKVVNKPFSGKTTEATKVADVLGGIDTEAVKTRNKNLFSKHRKANSPVNSLQVSLTEESDIVINTDVNDTLEETVTSQDFITLSPPTTESATKVNFGETTEYLTTLHHIFAEEVNDLGETDSTETTTESLNSQVTSTTGKIERLIEVNRIVQVKSKEAKLKNHVIEEQPTAEVVHPILDRIGEISRVTVIKVVDGNNTIIERVNSQENEIKEADPISPVFIPETTTEKSKVPPVVTLVELPATVQEVPAPSVQGSINLTDITVTIDKIADLLHTHAREDRKLDLPSKSNGLSSNNQIKAENKAEIIDGISHINVITPRPVFLESSTIALEGLFLTESTQSTSSKQSNDELLETEHSKFVNVRVLHPDANFGKEVRDNSKLLPIKLLKQDQEEVTVKAEVVEIKPKSNLETIRIVPIKVQMSKKISDSLPPILKVTPQDTNTEYT